MTLVEQLNSLFSNFLHLAAEASPWLLLGLLIAGLMKAWVPTKILSKHLGSGKLAIVKAAIIGAPLPLCSCGVIPVATELRRSGASAPATSSFLVATPETGVDSVSVSYAMLGPIFAIYRPITAILSAIATGLLVSTTKTDQELRAEQKTSTEKVSTACCGSKPAIAEKSSCCSKEKAEQTPETKIEKTSTCCSSKSNEDHTQPVKTEEDISAQPKAASCCASESKNKNTDSIISKTSAGVKYASTKLIDDLIVWLLIGLVFATLIKTFVPESFLLSYGSGLPAMLLMIAISIPMYICATASTPVAAGLIMAGLSPGTALVFMMAGPATNISTLGVIKNEMGTQVLVRYLAGISLCAIGFGLLLDWGLSFYQINISHQMSHSHELLPYWFGLTCAGVIAFLAVKPLRKIIISA